MSKFSFERVAFLLIFFFSLFSLALNVFIASKVMVPPEPVVVPPIFFQGATPSASFGEVTPTPEVTGEPEEVEPTVEVEEVEEAEPTEASADEE